MLNLFDFDEADQLLPHAQRCAKAIAKLKVRFKRKKSPVIYVNDNFGNWRSDWKELYASCTENSSPGKMIAELLKPEKDDYFILKPKHSAFYSTNLEVLLDELGVKTLVLTGIAGNICVMFTANDAHMRGYKIIVPSACIASNTKADNRYALRQFKSVFGFKISLGG